MPELLTQHGQPLLVLTNRNQAVWQVHQIYSLVALNKTVRHQHADTQVCRKTSSLVNAHENCTIVHVMCEVFRELQMISTFKPMQHLCIQD